MTLVIKKFELMLTRRVNPIAIPVQ